MEVSKDFYSRVIKFFQNHFLIMWDDDLPTLCYMGLVAIIMVSPLSKPTIGI